MFRILRKVAIAAVFLAALPLEGLASTISPGDNVANLLPLGANSVVSISYEPTTAVQIGQTSFTGIGFNNGADLALVRFGFGTPPGTSFASYDFNLGSTSGLGVLPSFTTSSPFTIYIETGATAFSTFVGYGFSVTALPAVPVPASGGLLLLAVGGIAALRRRKTRAA